MNPSEEFYLSKLYPLQDKALNEITKLNTPFYLTGGTVMSRVYCNHRFSDDLDFFVNYDKKFEEYVNFIAKDLKEKFIIEDSVSYDTFARLFIVDNSVRLKIEFINDVKYRVGEVISNAVFGRIDTWQNILVNKLTATVRNTAKDFSDLLFISYSFFFNWKEMILEMKEKDAWLDEVKVAENIEKFNPQHLSVLTWTIQPDFEKYSKDLITIAKDILLGNDNSLYNPAE